MSHQQSKPFMPGVEREAERILAEARRVQRFKAARERTALIEAIEYGKSDLAHCLLAHGVDPNATNGKGRSALWYAAYWTRNSVIRDLVERGARLPDDVLMGPVHHGEVETVRLLVRHGANVNCIASYTRYSSKFPQKEVLLTVAIRSVSLLGIAAKGAEAFRAAMTQKWRDAHPAPPASGDPEEVALMLIKAGANVNRLAFEHSLYGGFIHTILGSAAHFGLVRTIKAMLAAGADVNQKDTWGGTALLHAASEGNTEVARILLAAGANPEIQARDGSTPVTAARKGGFIALAEEIQGHTKRG